MRREAEEKEEKEQEEKDEKEKEEKDEKEKEEKEEKEKQKKEKEDGSAQPRARSPHKDVRKMQLVYTCHEWTHIMIVILDTFAAKAAQFVCSTISGNPHVVCSAHDLCGPPAW